MKLIHQSQPKTDPELIRQLNEAAAASSSVEAIFKLRPEHPKQIAMNPDRAEEVTHQLIDRVKEEVGYDACKVNILPYLSSFIIEAPVMFVRRLLEQPEIASAMANRQPEEGLPNILK
jgi:hypothetical protein